MKRALALVAALAALGACEILPGPEDLVVATNFDLLVTGASPGARVQVDIDEQSGAGVAQDDGFVAFHFALADGDHVGAVTVILDEEATHCGDFSVDIDGARETLSVDVRALAPCASGEGEGEGEGEAECTSDDDCAVGDAASCTINERCVGGTCVGSYDGTACGACEVDCSSTCGECCIGFHGSCIDACGLCLGDCTDDTCVCDASTCAHRAVGGLSTAMRCDHAICNNAIHEVPNAHASCDDASHCVIDISGPSTSADLRCEDGSFCELSSSGGDGASVAVECGSAAECSVSCSQGQSCTLSCALDASACFLGCGGVPVVCAPGELCTCAQ